jgi:hypothetical protein
MATVAIYSLWLCACAYSDQIDLLLLRLAAAIKKITGKDE